MKINSVGTFTTASTFVPLFEHKPREFKPLVIRIIHNENQDTKTQEPTSGSGASTQSGIAQEDQQTTSQTAEQAKP